MSEEMKKVFKKLEELEKKLSKERKEELNRAGKFVGRYMKEHSSEEVDSFIKSLPREEQIKFFAAELWNLHRTFKYLKLKGVVAWY